MKFTAAMAIPTPKRTPASTRFEPPSPNAKVRPETTMATSERPRAMVLVNEVCRTLTALSQGELPCWAAAGPARRSARPIVTRDERRHLGRCCFTCGFPLSRNCRNGLVRGRSRRICREEECELRLNCPHYTNQPRKLKIDRVLGKAIFKKVSVSESFVRYKGLPAEDLATHRGNSSSCWEFPGRALCATRRSRLSNRWIRCWIATAEWLLRRASSEQETPSILN
jgi:hypothetical protein